MSEKKPEEHRISAIPPFGLRMLPDLRRRVEEAAAENGRSLNAEIVNRLERSFLGNKLLAAAGGSEKERPPIENMYEVVKILYEVMDKAKELEDRGEYSPENMRKAVAEMPSLRHSLDKKP
ncbi:Arc family DNA-binding protein [Methylobacterium hispanicum]|uniref:Arc family DNA-binding protein n=1 Tax=Methylobacterium hispanicum TaxID=270350 RepID=UPI002F2EC282